MGTKIARLVSVQGRACAPHLAHRLLVGQPEGLLHLGPRKGPGLRFEMVKTLRHWTTDSLYLEAGSSLDKSSPQGRRKKSDLQTRIGSAQSRRLLHRGEVSREGTQLIPSTPYKACDEKAHPPQSLETALQPTRTHCQCRRHLRTTPRPELSYPPQPRSRGTNRGAM